MNYKEILKDLFAKGVEETKLEDGTEIEQVKWECGFPTPERGQLSGYIDGRKYNYSCWVNELDGEGKRIAEEQVNRQEEIDW